MVTIYPLNHPYGNYLDGYYTRNYQAYAEYFKSLSDKDIKHNANLGIRDGVTIIQNLEGDYKGYNMCIVEDETTSSLDIYKIVSKTYMGSGMWNVTMIIDAFSKYYTDIIESTILIERLGYKNYNEFNPILFGQENFTLSQVKKAQTPIKLTTYDTDEVRVGGYVMILQQDAFKTMENNEMTTDFEYNNSNIVCDYEVDGIKNFALKNNDTLIRKADNKAENVVVGEEGINELDIYAMEELGAIFYTWVYFATDGQEITRGQEGGVVINGVAQDKVNSKRNKGIQVLVNRDARENTTLTGEYSLLVMQSNIVNYVDKILDEYKDYSSYSSYNNKTVKDTATNKIYKISIIEEDNGEGITIKTTDDNDIMNEVFADGQSTSEYRYDFSGMGNKVRFGTKCRTYSVTLTQVTSSYTLSDTEVVYQMRNTTDQGYICIFVPYFWGADTVTITKYDGRSSKNYTYNQGIVKTILQAFNNKYGGDNGFILDIQEFYGLPQSFIDTIKYDLKTLGSRYENIEPLEIDGTEVRLTTTTLSSEYLQVFTLLYYAMDTTEGQTIIEQTLEGDSNLKLEQMNTYHLCSPSGTSVYEFSLAKNNGLNGFVYKYNVRPYASVYQLQPIYSGYYGRNYTDTRGLAMEEPTSITLTSSEWETYKRQNVNYINSFESNQEYERSKLQLDLDYQKEQYKMTRVRSGMNSIMGASQSMSEGLLSGNIAGGAVSGAYNIVNEGINSAITQAQFRNYQKHQSDSLALSQAEERRQWEYSLQNIQALPYNTEKLCEIYNTNTHYFYIETYTPTDYEISMYSRYLDLFGIKIGGILPLSAYSFDYLEGNIVKLSIGVTQEEYQELEVELQSGRRLYEVEE